MQWRRELEKKAFYEPSSSLLSALIDAAHSDDSVASGIPFLEHIHRQHQTTASYLDRTEEICGKEKVRRCKQRAPKMESSRLGKIASLLTFLPRDRCADFEPTHA